MAIINKQDTDGTKGDLLVGEFGLDVRAGNEKIYIGLTGTDSGEALVFENEIKEYIDDADNLKVDKGDVLELDNTIEFIPTSDYNPSTKKYVDDATDGTSTLELFNVTGSAPVYACRGWVNFNGTGTVAIRENGNVSSVTDNGTGNYTINFTEAISDANYIALATGKRTDDTSVYNGYRTHTAIVDKTTSNCRFIAYDSDSNDFRDSEISDLAIFR